MIRARSVLISIIAGFFLGFMISSHINVANAHVNDDVYRLTRAVEKIASELELIRKRCKID